MTLQEISARCLFGFSLWSSFTYGHSYDCLGVYGYKQGYRDREREGAESKDNLEVVIIQSDSVMYRASCILTTLQPTPTICDIYHQLGTRQTIDRTIMANKAIRIYSLC